MTTPLRIAVADDDIPVRNLFTVWLTQLGHRVTAVDGGRALVELCRAGPPDVVVSDVQMPDMDGLAAAEVIRREWAVPVILVSGSWTAAQARRAKALGAARLDKPLRALDLVAAVAATRTAAPKSAADVRLTGFLDVLAHELRNPLTPLLNYAQVLRMNGADDGVRAVAAKIDRQVRVIARLVEDLLDTALVCRGDGRLSRERVDLRSVVEAAAETVRPRVVAAGHALAVDPPAAPVWVDADPCRLEQVVVHLLTNACKYTPPGGRIDLTAGADGGWAAVRVRDTGVGIAADRLAGVFDLFARDERGGLGLGLAVVRELVALHGGTVAARSDGDGRGSEFVVRLPVYP